MAIQGLKKDMVLQVDVWVQTGVQTEEIIGRMRQVNPDLSDRDCLKVIEFARARTIEEHAGRDARLMKEQSVGWRRFIGWIMAGGKIGHRE